MKNSRVWLMVVAVFAISAGCQRVPESGKEKIYDIKGKVVAVEQDKKTVTIDHEDIPGFMKAMKMKFNAADAKLLEGIRPGDEVQGRLKVASDGYTLTELRKKP